MITFKMNNLDVAAEEGATILETARFYGLEIPTLCYMKGSAPYGGCRLCLVEVGEGPRAKLVSSCTYPVEEGLIVRTDTEAGRRRPADDDRADALDGSRLEEAPGLGLEVRGDPAAIQAPGRGMRVLRPLRPDLRRTDGRPGHRVPEPRL